MKLRELIEKLQEAPEELLEDEILVYREESDKYMNIYDVILSKNDDDFPIVIEVD